MHKTSGKANTFRFTVEPRYCHACKAREIAEAQYSKSPHHGLKIVVVDNEG